MKKIVLAVLLIILMATTMVEARTAYDVIYRGQVKMWPINSGDSLEVYYYADGRPCTVAWSNNWFYWLNNGTITTIHIYCASTLRGPWIWMYWKEVLPYSSSLPLGLSKGVYKFVIKNFKGGDFISLKIY